MKNEVRGIMRKAIVTGFYNFQSVGATEDWGCDCKIWTNLKRILI